MAVFGEDALNALNAESAGGNNNNNFTKFNVGTKLYVKVLGTSDLMMYDNYGIFGKVNSFVAKSPSKKTPKGFPVENLTPWDKAFKYHNDLSEKWQDEHSNEANKYKPERRFVLGFYDLTEGDYIVVDLSRNQAKTILNTVHKFEKRLDKMAFELTKEKTGAENTSVVVSLTPVMFPEEDLTDEQRKNFEEAPEEFDKSRFEGILYEMDEDEMIEKLVDVGFDVTKIGFDKPKKDDKEDDKEEGEPEFDF